MPSPIPVSIVVAWGDMDAFNHVNNTVYLRWFETARIRWFEQLGLLNRMDTERIGPILARTAIDYRRPVTYPDTVHVTVHVPRVGTTSLVLAYRVTSEAQHDALVAEGETVIVLLNYNTGEKIPLDAALREALEKWCSDPTPMPTWQPSPGSCRH